MQFINNFDERGNFLGLNVYNNGQNGQGDSHGHSYIYARRQKEKELGIAIGLGAEENPEDIIMPQGKIYTREDMRKMHEECVARENSSPNHE